MKTNNYKRKYDVQFVSFMGKNYYSRALNKYLHAMSTRANNLSMGISSRDSDFTNFDL